MTFISARALVFATTLGLANGLAQKPLKRDLVRTGVRSSSLPSYYHTTDELHNELAALAEQCDGLEVKSVEESDGRRGNVSLEFLHFKPKDGAAKPKLMMFANEHAREMITGEVALKFAQDMCRDTGLAAEARNSLEVLIVVNSNPFSRRLAESGQFCKRANPNNVDINRNWDDKFGGGTNLDQTNAGPAPFSEPETRLLKRIVEEFQPTAYVSVHSGFKGILYSNRYEHKAGLSFADRVFTEINNKYCNCPQGPADVTLNYHAAGTSLDYVADNVSSTQFSVAFELWPPADYNSAEDPDDETTSSRGSSFMQTRTGSSQRAKVAAEMTEEEIETSDPSWCLHAFNPVSRRSFDSTVNNFRRAFAELALSLSKDANEWKKLGAN